MITARTWRAVISLRVNRRVLFHQIFLAVVDVKTSCGRFAVQSASVQRVPSVVLLLSVSTDVCNACRTVEEGLEL